MPALLALADTPNYPKAPLAFQVQIGWLLLAIAGCIGLWVWSRRDTLRRGLLGLEDPRVYAMLRFGLAWLLIQSFWEMYPYWRLLWSDEGLFLLDAARSRYGSSALAGWHSEDGFFDAWGIVRYFWGSHSLFLIHGAPAFVNAYMWVFFGVLAAYAVGFRARTTGLLAWLMTLDVYDRTSLYSEGTDSAFRCLFFVLIFAHTGAAWSVDNWIRVRRVRAHRAACELAGRLLFDRQRLVDHLVTWAWVVGWSAAFCKLVAFDLTGPLQIAGLGFVGVVLEALAHHRIGVRSWSGVASLPQVVIYRWVPRWPRVLIMFQWIALYVTTGAVKTGNVWAQGDALYYALNMDHFYRFEGITQQVSALFSLGIFRIFTWVTHFWEIGFFLLGLGMFLLFCERHRETWWARAESGRRLELWLGRLGLLVAYGLVYRVAVIVFPFCLAMSKSGELADSEPALKAMHIAFAGVVPVVVATWLWLTARPLVLWPGGLSLARLPIARLRGRVVPTLTIDGPFLRRWLLGRRLWLGLGVIFHGQLILFMNIGMFPFIMLHAYFAYFRSDDLVTPLARFVKLVARRRDSRRVIWRLLSALISPRIARGLHVALAPEIEPEPGQAREHYFWHPNLWFRGALGTGSNATERGAALNGAWLALFMVMGLGLILIRAFRPELAELLADAGGQRSRMDWIGDAVRWWWLAIVAVAVVMCFRKSPDAGLPAGTRVGVPLISSPIMRVAVTSFALVHAACIVQTLFPSFPIFSAVRGPAGGLFGDWLRVTHTTQSWRMFAPNPPRSNAFMQTVVIAADGNQWDLRNNALHDRPNPWIVNDRMRKMQRRMIGKSTWYLAHWAEFQCREWMINTGEPPRTVIVNKLWTKIPSPSDVYFNGAYVPSELKVYRKELKRLECGDNANPPAYMKRRLGIEITQSDLDDEKKLADKTRQRDERTARSWARRKNFGGEGASVDDARGAKTATSLPARTRSDD